MKDTAKILADPDTAGTVVLMVILRDLGVEALDDDPALIWAALHERHGVWISEELENKVQALLMVSEFPQRFGADPEFFIAVVAALLDGDIQDVVDGVFDYPEIDDILWAMHEVQLAIGDVDPQPGVQAIIDHVVAQEAPEDINDILADMEDRAERLCLDMEACGFPPSAVQDTRREQRKLLGSAGDVSPGVGAATAAE